jgi:hypothetical protein
LSALACRVPHFSRSVREVGLSLQSSRMKLVAGARGHPPKIDSFAQPRECTFARASVTPALDPPRDSSLDVTLVFNEGQTRCITIVHAIERRSPRTDLRWSGCANQSALRAPECQPRSQLPNAFPSPCVFSSTFRAPSPTQTAQATCRAPTIALRWFSEFSEISTVFR